VGRKGQDEKLRLPVGLDGLVAGMAGAELREEQPHLLGALFVLSRSVFRWQDRVGEQIAGALLKLRGAIRPEDDGGIAERDASIVSAEQVVQGIGISEDSRVADGGVVALGLAI